MKPYNYLKKAAFNKVNSSKAHIKIYFNNIVKGDKKAISRLLFKSLGFVFMIMYIDNKNKSNVVMNTLQNKEDQDSSYFNSLIKENTNMILIISNTATTSPDTKESIGKLKSISTIVEKYITPEEAEKLSKAYKSFSIVNSTSSNYDKANHTIAIFNKNGSVDFYNEREFNDKVKESKFTIYDNILNYKADEEFMRLNNNDYIVIYYDKDNSDKDQLIRDYQYNYFRILSSNLNFFTNFSYCIADDNSIKSLPFKDKFTSKGIYLIERQQLSDINNKSVASSLFSYKSEEFKINKISFNSNSSNSPSIKVFDSDEKLMSNFISQCFKNNIIIKLYSNGAFKLMRSLEILDILGQQNYPYYIYYSNNEKNDKLINFIYSHHQSKVENNDDLFPLILIVNTTFPVNKPCLVKLFKNRKNDTGIMKGKNLLEDIDHFTPSVFKKKINYDFGEENLTKFLNIKDEDVTLLNTDLINESPTKSIERLVKIDTEILKNYITKIKEIQPEEVKNGSYKETFYISNKKSRENLNIDAEISNNLLKTNQKMMTFIGTKENLRLFNHLYNYVCVDESKDFSFPPYVVHLSKDHCEIKDSTELFSNI